MTACRDNGREPCTVPRCHVLALCAAQFPYGPQSTLDGESARLRETQFWLLERAYVEHAPNMMSTVVEIPCDHDGIDWGTVLMFLDWLELEGWSWETVHRWAAPYVAERSGQSGTVPAKREENTP